MFKKKDKLDIETINESVFILKKILKIGFVFAILCLIFLVTRLVKEWNILSILKEFFVVISPIFIGLLIAWLFDPITKFLQKKKIPKLLSCLIVYIVFIGILVIFFALLMPNLINQIKDFAGTVPALLKSFKAFINNLFNNFSNNHDIDLTSIKVQLFDEIEKTGINMTTKMPNTLLNIAKKLISGSMTFVLGLMIGFYMLFDFDKLNTNFNKILPVTWRDGANNILPVSWKDDYKELTHRINTSLRGYVQGVFIVMLLVFITQGVGLTLAGIKAPLIFAMFCALTDIIPYFGPYIGAIPAILVGFTQSPVVGICCIISIVVVQLLENNFYQPLIMGHTMKLHPVTFMIGLLIFEHFFGIIGMIIATPVISALKIIITFINEKTNFVGMIQKTNENIE